MGKQAKVKSQSRVIREQGREVLLTLSRVLGNRQNGYFSLCLTDEETEFTDSQ